jgi:predicted DNA-binding antitoxin AbrB/MazE fold protein
VIDLKQNRPKGGRGTMAKVIDAIYENGVFKPLEKVDIKEHEKVEIKIVSRDDWQLRFDRIIGKIHKKSSQFSPEEIEADIATAIQEVREAKRGR